jgi:hypothetical protein
MVEVVLVLCRSRRSFVDWCDEHAYDLDTEHSPIGARGDESLAVRVIKLGDLDGFVADRIEVLDGFSSRPDAQILARYARSHLRSAPIVQRGP